MHQCLRDNFQKLADTCRKEELKLNIIQSRDVRLRPKLQKACSEEIAVYCKDTQPGAQWRPASRTCFKLPRLPSSSCMRPLLASDDRQLFA